MFFKEHQLNCGSCLFDCEQPRPHHPGGIDDKQVAVPKESLQVGVSGMLHSAGMAVEHEKACGPLLSGDILQSSLLAGNNRNLKPSFSCKPYSDCLGVSLKPFAISKVGYPLPAAKQLLL